MSGSVAATLVVVLLVLGEPAFSSARYAVENWSSATPTRGLLESNQPSTVATHLMHVDHIDSPYKQPNLTLLERAQNAAKRSKSRLSYLGSKRKRLGVKKEIVTSPVNSDQVDYVMKISAGTPPRVFSAFVDTGSDLNWFQCTPCLICLPEPDPEFDPSTSSSYKPISCTEPLCIELNNTGGATNCPTTGTACLYEYQYADGSFTEGDMAFETFSLIAPNGTETALPNIGFGCGTNQGGGYGAYDGLVGLGGGPLSLVSQLASSIAPVFSYCLVSYAAAATQTSTLTLGSAPDGLSYTPLINNTFDPIYSTFYYVNLVGITVNAVPIIFPNGTFAISTIDGSGGFILDSGTTITQLFDEAFIPLKNAISALIPYPTVYIADLDPCYDTSSVSAPVFPTVVFQFQDGVDLSMPPDNIFQPVDNLGTYCMYIQSAGLSSDSYGSLSVFGNTQQQNFEIAYDLANARIGFKATTC